MAMRKRRAQEETNGVADEIPGIHLATEEEGRAIFERQVLKGLGISGDEFLERWDAGEYHPVLDDTHGRMIERLAMLIPFVRHTTS